MARGINAEQVESITQQVEEYSTIPCYIGGAPIWQVDNENWKQLAGKSLLLKTEQDAKKKMGYLQPESGTWPKYASLCEMVYLHFKREEAVGPIAVILNGTEPTESEIQTQDVAIIEGKGTLRVAGKGILSSVTIESKEKGNHFSVSYDESGQNIIIVDTGKNLSMTETVQYKEVTGLDALELSGVFDNIDYMQQDINVIPYVVAAPGWENESLSDSVTVADKLQEIAEGKINNHWRVQAYSQLYDKTFQEAIQNKTMKSHKVKSCWPFARIDERVFHLSALFVLSKLILDTENDGIPFESASNEVLDIDGICDADGQLIRLKEIESNRLNEYGIATVNFLDGSWRTWGIRMSNYKETEADTIKKEKLTDVAVQMLDYICNDFQKTYIDLIDKSISEKNARDIAEDYQNTRLDAMVKDGSLLYGKIELNKGDAEYSLSGGNFVFSIDETSTPPGNSITAKVRYSEAGLAPETEEGEY